MTAEQILMSGITAVTGALVFIAKELWERSEQCESDRKELRQEIENVKTKHGEYHGLLTAVGSCGKSACQFAPLARAASSQSITQ